MILTYKYRIKDRSAHKTLRRHAYAANQVWNWCVAQQRDIESRYRAGAPKRKWPTHFDLGKSCKGVGRELGLHQQSIEEVCRQFTQSRDKAKHSPRFRASGGSRRALGWIPFKKQSRQINGNSITYLGKRYRFWEGRRPAPETAKGGCFVEDARGRWYVCFYVEVDNLPIGTSEVGIDLGLKTLATCSDGTSVPALQHYRKYEAALGIAQRANNKNRVRAIYAKVANARRDQLHKATTKIAAENQLIVVGNVSSVQLAKTRMAKSVLDASWGMLRNQLRYKASRHGARYVEVDERWTSQTCSSCGAIPASSPKGMGALGIRSWECSDCGTVHDRDVNAARNILRVGQSALPLAEESQTVA